MKTYKRIFFLIILSLLFITSCIPVSKKSSRNRNFNSMDKQVQKSSNTPKTNNGGIGGGNNNLGGGLIDSLIKNGRPSIQQIIDPTDGTFRTKITIPKNFSKMLYLTGLNINSLRDKLIKVRFYLGRENEMVEVSATMGRIPGGGIVASTDVQAIMIDMSSQPFKNVRLLYDLFDYNNYDTNGNSTEFDVTDTLAPVSDPKNVGLYCRGLDLQNDSTFSGAGNNNACDGTNEECKYAYAKLLDRGLTGTLTTKAQIDFAKSGALSGDITNLLTRCLPETAANKNSFEALFGLGTTGLTADAEYGTSITAGGISYLFKGPYMISNYENWAIEGQAIYGKFGIFKDSTNPLVLLTALPAVLKKGVLTSVPDNNTDSLLFPRFGKMNFTQGTVYLGAGVSGAANSEKTEQVMSLAGVSNWMNGCSIRKSSYNDLTGESVSSCNVTGRIEVVTTDLNTGVVTVLDSSVDLKLQLIRASQTDVFQDEVLFTSLNSCNSATNTGCGGNECCFNNKCWSKNVVAQCPGDINPLGNKPVGTSCQSDLQCSSLCCDQSTGRCNVHKNDLNNKVLCGKAPGQTCVASEWCKEELVNNCFIVKTGVDANGNQTCTKRCYPIKTVGSCVAGICQPPVALPSPAFDPLNPDCKDAIDPL